MKKVRKIMLAVILAITTFTTTASASVITITNIDSVNNSSDATTYKIQEDDFKNTANNINTHSSKVNINGGTQYKNIKGENEKRAWLLEHDVLSNDINISSDGSEINTSQAKVSDGITKSDFVMALVKAVYGVQRSRPIIFKTQSAIRTEDSGELDENGEPVILDYSEGNYKVYFSPNVYELYFRLLLDKGILGTNEFKNIDFINQYNNYGIGNSFPKWSNELNATNKPDGRSNGQGNILGQAFEVKSNESDGTFSSNFKGPNYFTNEKMTTYEALELIEKILRIEEGDMTNTEAKIASYKYGARSICKMSDEMKNTVMYLITKGILNFENDDEFSMVYSNLNKTYFTELLYRVANKNARLNFSEIQLTDSDNFWLDKGFYEDSVEINVNTDAYVSTYKIEEGGATASRDSNKLLASRDLKYQAIGAKTYRVTKIFDNDGEYYYQGKNIHDLSVDNKVVALKEDCKAYNGKAGVKIQFLVEAQTSYEAEAIVDARITIPNNAGTSNSVPCVSRTYTDSDGNNEVYYYISKESLSKINTGGSNKNEIIAVADKYLINNLTGTQCLLLDGDKKAIVGNEIIDTEDVIVKGVEGEVYYNLNLIARLMSNSYISNIGGATHLYSTYRKNESTIDVVTSHNKNSNMSYSNNDYIDTALEANFDGTDFYSLTHLQRAGSCLFKDISKDLKTEHPVYMVVRWSYVTPTSTSDIGAVELSNLYKKYESNDWDVYTISSFLTTPPTTDLLKVWWDSNVGISDALCNYLLGTKGIKYFTSGYLTPKIDIVTQEQVSDSDMNNLLNSKLELDATYKSRFLSSNKNIVGGIFNATGLNLMGSLVKARTLDYIYGNPVSNTDADVVNYKDQYYRDKNGTLFISYGPAGRDTRLEKFKSNRENINGVGNLKSGSSSNYVLCTSIKDKTESKTILELKAYVKQKIQSSDSANYYVIDDAQLQRNYSNGGNTSASISFGGNASTHYLLGAAIDGKCEVRTNGSQVTVTPTINDLKLSEYYKKLTDYSSSDTGYYINTEDEGMSGSKDSYRSYYLLDTKQVRALIDKGKVKLDNDSYLICAEKGKAYTDAVAHVYHYKNDKMTRLKDSKKILSMNGKNVKVMTGVLLKRSCWGYDGSDSNKEVLKKSKWSTVVSRMNVLNTGVTSAIIDSIVQKCYGSVAMSDIPDGTTVLIGNYTFVKKNNLLCSSVYNMDAGNVDVFTNLASNIKNETALKSVVGKAFDSVNLNVTLNNQSINGTILAKYITGSTLTDNYVGDKCNKTLVKKGSKYYIVGEDGKYNPYTAGSDFYSLCYGIALSKSIRFRPVTSDGSVYALMSVVATEETSGYMSKVPFYTSTLNFTWDEDVYSIVGKSDYAEAEDYSSLMDAIRKAFLENQRGDIIGLLRMYLFDFLAYAIVMNFVGLFLYKQTTIYTMLEKIRKPRGESTGPDVLKIITLGLHRLDVESSLSRVVGIDFILILILVLLYKFM